MSAARCSVEVTHHHVLRGGAHLGGHAVAGVEDGAVVVLRALVQAVPTGLAVPHLQRKPITAFTLLPHSQVTEPQHCGAVSGSPVAPPDQPPATEGQASLVHKVSQSPNGFGFESQCPLWTTRQNS